MKKRFLSVLLCAVMALSFVACGDSNTDDTQNNGKEVTQPSITKLAEYKDFATILTGDYAVTDEKVKTYASDIIYSAGIGFIEVKDRDTVQAGDIVKTDYTGYLNGTAFSGGAATDQWIDVTKNCGIDESTGNATGYFIDGFTNGLVGAKVGQKTSSEVTFPADYGNKDLAGKLTTFEFNVKGIYTVVTPDTLTDAMVAETFKDTYEVSTVADFMQMMKKELAYNLVMNYVVENSTFDISSDYLDYRLAEYQTFFTELYCSGLDLETFLAYNGTTVDAMRAQWASALQSQIKAELVFAAIVKDAGLQVNEEELAAYVAEVTKIASGSNGNSFYAKEANIYRAKGAGNVEAGKAILLNQTAVGDYIMENYQ